MSTGIFNDVIDEVTKANAKFSPYASPHEGYAVIYEELDELWDEVKKNADIRDNDKMYNEAKQVACTAIRFMEMIK